MAQDLKKIYIGIDVSAKTLDIALCRGGNRKPRHTKFPNTSAGHQQLLKLIKEEEFARIVLESTGVYSLGIAIACDDHPNAEVMVVNPHRMHRFSQASSSRGKTDKSDAHVILKFAQTMDFVAWNRPSNIVLTVRRAMRRIHTIKSDIVQEKNRLAALKFEKHDDLFIKKDIETSIEMLEERASKLLCEAEKLAAKDESLYNKFKLLVTIKGIGKLSALYILAELAVLPDDMTAPQWVAHTGLEPKVRESGTSVRGVRQISKAGNHYLRLALYMPAMVAKQKDEQVGLFAQRLEARGKPPKVVTVAIMRKLLHTIWGMFRYNQNYDPMKFNGGAQKA